MNWNFQQTMLSKSKDRVVLTCSRDSSSFCNTWSCTNRRRRTTIGKIISSKGELTTTTLLRFRRQNCRCVHHYFYSLKPYQESIVCFRWELLVEGWVNGYLARATKSNMQSREEGRERALRYSLKCFLHQYRACVQRCCRSDVHG